MGAPVKGKSGAAGRRDVRPIGTAAGGVRSGVGPPCFDGSCGDGRDGDRSPREGHCIRRAPGGVIAGAGAAVLP